MARRKLETRGEDRRESRGSEELTARRRRASQALMPPTLLLAG